LYTGRPIVRRGIIIPNPVLFQWLLKYSVSVVNERNILSFFRPIN
jgi:hypothetical protein